MLVSEIHVEKSSESKKFFYFSHSVFFLCWCLLSRTKKCSSSSEIHSIYTRHRPDLHPPLLHLSKSQKGVYFLESRYLITYLKISLTSKYQGFVS